MLPQRSSTPLRRRADVVTLVVSVTVTVTTAIAANASSVGAAERALFSSINGLPGSLEPGLYLIQLGGLVGVPIALAALAALLRRWRLAVALTLALPLKEVLEHAVLKQLVDRRRPAVNEPGVVLRHAPTEGLAFPSGHAIVACAVAGLVAPYLPRPAQVSVFGVAALVCVARVYLGAHNPLDVIVGAAVGLGIASALNLTLGISGEERAGERAR